MRRVNNFNKKKKKSLRRGEQPRRAIRFASKHARPDLRPPFPFVAPKSWRRTVPRCIIRRDDAPRRVPLFVRWNEEFSIAIIIISFFPFYYFLFSNNQRILQRENKIFQLSYRVILLCLKGICIVSCEMAVRFICIVDFGLIFVRMKKNLNLFSCRKHF